MTQDGRRWGLEGPLVRARNSSSSFAGSAAPPIQGPRSSWPARLRQIPEFVDEGG